MSNASAGTPSDPLQRTSEQPGALALLTATAVGGVIASRLGKTPLFLAAGMAAYALLTQKKSASQPQAQQPPPTPFPPVENTAVSQVEQWLSQQISRDEQAPALDLSAAADPVFITEDDYLPQPFLLDDVETEPASPEANHSFTQLADPVEWHMPVSAEKNEEQADISAQPSSQPDYPSLAPVDSAPEFVAEAPPAVYSAPAPVYSAPFPAYSAASPVYSAPSPPYTIDPQVDSAPAPVHSTWALGVEPLPSISAVAPFSTPTSSLFIAAPVQQEAVAPPPVFSIPTSVFEGGVFPDEISVIPAIEPVAHLTPSAPESFSSWAVPEFETIQPQGPSADAEPHNEVPAEIEVHLASPGEGEASFDPPLAAASQNPWDVLSEPAPASAPLQKSSIHPLVEAEIILRPRAPTQNTVTTKIKPGPETPIQKKFAESFDTPSTEGAGEPPPASPQEAPKEPRARPAWSSWWSGD